MITPSPIRCGLCCEPAELQESHILPAFVYRWLKETSITGYLRAGENPQKRVQDGLKVHLLCSSCEERFSRWETFFANEIFYPYNADERLKAHYAGWMLKFCVSVSWRALKYVLLRTGLRDWTDEQLAEAHSALAQWKAFLLDEIRHPGSYEQHLLPLAAIESCSIPNLPRNMNRYLMRGVEIDVARGEFSAFTYAKMGRFAVFGIIRPMKNQFRGTRVEVKRGIIQPKKFTLPHEVLDYLMNRARRSAELMEAIPEHQLDKIEAKYMRDPTRVVVTDEFAAMLSDERMFGTDAILRKPKGKNP